MNANATLYRPERIGSRSLKSLAGTFFLVAILIVALPLMQYTEALEAPKPEVVPVVSEKPPDEIIVDPPSTPETKPGIVSPVLEKEATDDIPFERIDEVLNISLAVDGDFTAPGWIVDVANLATGDICYIVKDLDNRPRTLSSVAPVYPFPLKREGITGFARILLKVDKRGRVEEVRVESASHREFGESAVEAVMQWRFEPGIKNGKRVSFQLMQPISFRLK